jgi:hypothetical protein
MSAYQRWCASLEQTLEACRDGQALDLEAVKRLGLEARAIAPELDNEQRQQLEGRISMLSEMMREGMRRLDEEMAEMSGRRAGVRGYGQLRTKHTGQRLRRRA